MKNAKRSTRAGTAAMSNGLHTVEREKEMLRSEFEVMRKLNFTFIEEIGARNAEEYVIKVTSLEFFSDEDSMENKN